MMRSVLVTLADRAFLPAARQLFSSAHRAGGWKGDYALIAHEVPAGEARPFVDRGIHVLHVAALAEGAFGALPAVVASKFHLFDDYFKQWDRVVYLDGDIIVRACLDRWPLLPGLGAVRDYCDMRAQFSPAPLPFPIRNGPAFNSGVLSFESSLLQPGMLGDLTRMLRENRNVCRFGDQTILNLYFQGKWSPLPSDWNGFAHLKAFSLNWPPFTRSSVVHFAMKPKPWQATGQILEEWTANYEAFSSLDLARRTDGRLWTPWQAARGRAVRWIRRRISRLDTLCGALGSLARTRLASRGARP